MRGLIRTDFYASRVAVVQGTAHMVTEELDPLLCLHRPRGLWPCSRMRVICRCLTCCMMLKAHAAPTCPAPTTVILVVGTLNWAGSEYGLISSSFILSAIAYFKTKAYQYYIQSYMLELPWGAKE